MRRVLLAVLAPALLTGCYTLLRHPRVESDAEVEEAPAVVLQSDCAACHSDWDLERYGYTFHPGWYPLAGAWPRWYYDPWWWDVVTVQPPPARDGVRVEQSAGLENDRGSATGSGTASGVWMPGGGTPPPSGIGTLLDPGPRPQSSDPPDTSNAPAPGSTGRTGSPAETPARPGATTATESAPPPAERVNEPRSGTGSSTTPATRNAAPTKSPRGSERAGGRAKEGADAGRAATPSPSPPPKPDRDEPKPSQGRGMPNDRREPKP